MARVRWIAAVVALLVLCVRPGHAAASDVCVPSRGRVQGALESRCESLLFEGRTRTYRVYAPARAHEAALLFVLHGGGGSGSNMELLTHGAFNRIADRDGVIVVYPDGIGRNWNDGRTDIRSKAANEHIDDVGFFRALVHALSAQYSVDAQRIYATGISNGGFMSLRLACDAADLFAAVAPVAATLSVDTGPVCKPSRPISVAIMDGTDDPLVKWNGGQVGLWGIKRGMAWSVQQTFDTLANLDGCRESSVDPLRDAVPEDGTSVIVHHRTGCEGGAEVRLYEIRGGGHTWPGGVQYLGERIVGKVSREIDGVAEVWGFLGQHRLH